MRFLGRAAALLALVFFLVSAGFADEKKTDKKSDDTSTTAASASAAQPAGTPAAADVPVNTGTPAPISTATDAAANAATPAPTPAAPVPTGITERPRSEEEAPKWTPMPAWNGNEGLFTLETGEILPRGAFDFTAGANKISRMPGDITVLEVGPAFGFGVSHWLSVFMQIDANDHIHVDTPGLLSLNFPQNPQFQNTIYPRILPNFIANPAYVEDFPFASHNGGGVGEVDLGFKIGFMSERRGDPFSLSIRNDFFLPTKTSFTDLVSNQVQYGTFNYGIGVQASKHLLHKSMLATVNLGYRFSHSSSYQVIPTGGTVAQTEKLRLSDQFSAGLGLLMFPDKRFQIITEYSGIVFVGNGIPNTTFGARDPVDSTEGVRLYLFKRVALDVGYRYSLTLSQHADRNGFIAKLGIALRNEKSPRAQRGYGAEDSLTSTCSVDAPSVGAGTIVQATVTAVDTLGYPLSFSWTATGGTIDGRGPYARWDSTGVAPGNYTLTVSVGNGAGKTTTCTSTVTVR
jgi:hypothetical protein